MIKGEKLTAVIPVRGGSVGIPRKNLLELAGTSILQRAIQVAKRSRFVDAILVSTDDEEMDRIARSEGVAAPALRPASLATADALTVDVVMHLIETVPISEGYILLLQTTCPLRRSQDLDAMCETFSGHDSADAIVSLAELQDPHPMKVQAIEDGWVRSYLGVESMVPRQSLPPAYRLNGAFYLTHRDMIVEKRTFLPPRTLPFIMPPERSVNLDTMMDVRFLEYLVRANVVSMD